MPRNKKQGIIFGGIMSYAMAYGMEVYNVAIKEGINLSAGGLSNMTNIIFWEALKEAAYMGILVFIFSSPWGNRLLRQAAPFSHWLFGKLFPQPERA